jgi:hypothetical protein
LLLNRIGDGHVVGKRVIVVVHGRQVTRGLLTKTAVVSFGIRTSGETAATRIHDRAPIGANVDTVGS